jgi:hypothetical protein
MSDGPLVADSPGYCLEEDVLAAFEAAGCPTTVRQLKRYRSTEGNLFSQSPWQVVLPKGRGTQTRYPLATLDDVKRIADLQEYLGDFNEMRVRLWLAGQVLDPAVLGNSLLALCRKEFEFLVAWSGALQNLMREDPSIEDDTPSENEYYETLGQLEDFVRSAPPLPPKCDPSNTGLSMLATVMANEVPIHDPQSDYSQEKFEQVFFGKQEDANFVLPFDVYQVLERLIRKDAFVFSSMEQRIRAATGRDYERVRAILHFATVTLPSTMDAAVEQLGENPFGIRKFVDGVGKLLNNKRALAFFALFSLKIIDLNGSDETLLPNDPKDVLAFLRNTKQLRRLASERSAARPFGEYKSSNGAKTKLPIA